MFEWIVMAKKDITEDTNIRKPETNDIAEVHINLIMNKISRNIVPIGRRNMAAAFIFDKYPLKSG
jgi:hypothetical protein